MRETVKKETLQPATSLRFLYRTRLGALCLKLITARWISKVVGHHLDGKFSRRKIKKYVKKHGIDMTQYEKEEYASFNAFFTRHIRKELRPFDLEPTAFVSPCDGKLSVYEIDENSKFEIKGYTYTVETLLKNKDLAEKFRGGLCLVFRLCVEDYHRYFYFDNGTKDENVFIKGKLHTVQPVALEKRRVFTENCREYTLLHTENFADAVQCEVGAMMVGRIVNNDGAGVRFTRGTEKGKFEFGGSTIVVLLQKDVVLLDDELKENTDNGDETVVKCGEKLGIKKGTAQ